MPLADMTTRSQITASVFCLADRRAAFLRERKLLRGGLQSRSKEGVRENGGEPPNAGGEVVAIKAGEGAAPQVLFAADVLQMSDGCREDMVHFIFVSCPAVRIDNVPRQEADDAGAQRPRDCAHHRPGPEHLDPERILRPPQELAAPLTPRGELPPELVLPVQNLFAQLPHRRRLHRLAFVDVPPREADLVLVRAHVARAPRVQQACLPVNIQQRDQDGRSPLRPPLKFHLERRVVHAVCARSQRRLAF
mmetsp:Transcript_7401/g.18734  ORF Transcript_7401/g.18734 Transcript_7401/m.18734 type:complete len:249 (-) Transcript_7401:396-1142(-)